MIVKASLAITAPIPPQHKATAGSTLVSNDRKRIFPAPPRPEVARYSTRDINTIRVPVRQSKYPQRAPLGARKNPRVSSLHQSILVVIYQIVARPLRDPGAGRCGRSRALGVPCRDAESGGPALRPADPPESRSTAWIQSVARDLRAARI